MPRLERVQELDQPVDVVWAWHTRPGAFQRLTAPWAGVELSRQEGLHVGAEIAFRMHVAGVPIPWVGRHTEYVEGERFVDEQVRGPFASWTHTHRFEAVGQHTRLTDTVDYELGPFTGLAKGKVGRDLAAMFAFRHRRLRADLDRHAAVRERGPQRVVITGASGLVGSELVPFLTTGGHSVQQVSRQAPAPGSGDLQWDLAAGRMDAAALEGADAVIHLAGESVAGRFTADKKAKILSSRVQGTDLLCRTLAGLARPPRVLISASAIGIYGDRGDARIDEQSQLGEGFLADVGRAWEGACDPARDAGIRVVNLRIGVVLSAKGGALAAMVGPANLGLGGPIGSGQQGVSWIAMDDLVYALHHLVYADTVTGPANGTAPAPCAQAELAKTLGKVLRRPAFLPAPGFAIRAALGEMGQALLLDGAYVHPEVLLASGYRFEHSDLEGALRAELG